MNRNIIINLTILAIIWIYFGTLLELLYTGNAPGIESGHPFEYLQSTFIVCGIVLSILPILAITSVIRLPWWFDLILYLNVGYYGMSLFLGLYLDIEWWGNMTHTISGLVVGAVIFIALCLIEVHSPDHVTLGSKWGLIVVEFVICVSFGGIWEICEGYTDIITGHSYMSYGAWDSLLDLQADMIGATVMAAITFLILRKKTCKDIADQIQIRLRHKSS